MDGKSSYLPAVDGLRAIAVLAVVAYHAGLPVAGGFVGVDVFFVISGYLITRLLQDELASTGSIDLRSFYARRIRRIYPALVLVVATTIALSGLLSTPAREALLRSALASLAMVGNLHFQAVTGGYFDASSDSMPLLHLWSLGVEEQFYLVWPLVLAFLVRGRPVVVALLAAVSLALAQWLLLTDPQAAFFQMPARWWELAAGAWLAMRPLPAAPSRWPALAGAALLLGALLIPPPPGQFPGLGAAPAVIGTVLVIRGNHAGGTLYRLLASRPLVTIGLISYSLYLWHWPLLAIYRATQLGNDLSAEVALCAAAGGIAWLSYRYIETPLRRPRRARRRMAAATLCAAVFAAFIVPARNGNTELGDLLVTDTSVQSCLVDLRSTEPEASDCRPLDADVVLWGDSHASVWRPLAERMGKVAEFTKGACKPVVDYRVEYPGIPRHPDDCAAHNRGAMRFIAAHRPTVVVAAYFHGQADTMPHVAAAIEKVAPSARTVWLLVPTPYMQRHVRDCQRLRIDCGMSRDAYDAYARPIRTQMLELAARHPNVRLIETEDFFCTDERCPMERGFTLYRDSHHISVRAAREFAIRWEHSSMAPTQRGTALSAE